MPVDVRKRETPLIAAMSDIVAGDCGRSPLAMRAAGVRGVPIYCADYLCSHSTAVSADNGPMTFHPLDLGPRFICSACGKRGADVRPDFNWSKPRVSMMAYRRPGIPA